jgi:hypothetical protein
LGELRHLRRQLERGEAPWANTEAGRQLLRRYLPRWWPTDGKVTLFDPMTVPVTRYRYRADNIPSLWRSGTIGTAA